MNDKVDELLISHDELMIYGKVAMEILLHAGLSKRLANGLKEAGVQPGFAERAQQAQEKFHRERLLLMASGDIK